MKKFFSLIFIVFPFGLCHAAPAFVQAKSAQAGGASNATANLTVTAGNMLYVTAGFNGNGSGCGANTISISDGVNTYNAIEGYQSQSFNCSRNYYATNIAGGAITISVNDTANQAKAFTAYEISGADTLDAHNVKFCNTSPCTSATFSTTANDEIAVAGGVTYYGGTYTAGNIGGVASTIPTGGSQNNADGSMSTMLEYVTFNSQQTTITAAASQSGTIYWQYFVATFSSTGGGGGPTATPLPTRLNGFRRTGIFR
jgi:hypothetical protein